MSSQSLSQFPGKGANPPRCWLCGDKTQAWQALVPLHLDPDALFQPGEKLGCMGQKWMLFGQVTVLGHQSGVGLFHGLCLPFSRGVAYFYFYFCKSWLRDPSVPRLLCNSSFFSATCQKVSLAFHIARMKFSVIQSEQHWWKGPRDSCHLLSGLGVYLETHAQSQGTAVPGISEEYSSNKSLLCTIYWAEVGQDKKNNPDDGRSLLKFNLTTPGYLSVSTPSLLWTRRFTVPLWTRTVRFK